METERVNSMADILAERVRQAAEKARGSLTRRSDTQAPLPPAKRLPKGYDTPIGVGGNVLSGGMRQRVALARAMYGDPVLVVLDEPNANLDDVGERALDRAVARMKQRGQTVLLITHRPGAIALADQLVLLKEGHVEHAGPRDLVLKALRRPAPATTA